MSKLRLITWNINSVRLRIKLLEKLAQQTNADIICLQETKVRDEQFPLKDIRKMGFEYTVFRGEKGYNGVAILSKVPIELKDHLNIANSEDSRHISAIIPGGIELHNFYVPAGGDEPNIETNDKFKFKLDYVDSMHDWFKNNRSANDNMIMVGDLNIAPFENDVWSHKQLLKIISHTPEETSRMHNLRENLAWIDIARHFTPEPEKIYSWWSYRNRDWKKSNRGRRLDHIWVTSPLKDRLESYEILQDVRDWEKPSDHVPVVMDLTVI